MTQAENKLLKDSIDGLKDAIDREADERKKQLADLKFVALDQWPDAVRKQREGDVNGPRPCLTIDKISQYRMQIINDIRRNRPAVKVRPVDSGSDPETADVIQGLTRHIEDISSADISYETAAEWAIDTGCGYFRFVTDYVDEKSFDQEIYIRSVMDGFSVYLGPHLMPDGSDAEEGYVIQDMKKSRFEREFPKAKVPTKDVLDTDSPFWIGDESVRVAERFYFVYEPIQLVLLTDGQAMTREEYDALETKPEIADERDSVKRSVKWCKLTGTEILEERDWAGIYIPIVKVTGHQKIVEGKKLTWGIVRPAIDSARMYNYWASTITEKLALAPKSPYVAAEGQLEGHEEEWAQANRSNIPVLQYKAIDVGGNAVPAPRRVEPAQMEVAMINQLKIIEHDIQTSLGMFKASVGENQGDQSGRAIKALQSQSDTATFHFPDNLALSIRHGGRILVDLIPKIYDTARTIRIIGTDDIPKQVTLDPQQAESKKTTTSIEGKVRTIYNIGVGKYDVTVTVGPSYATKRMETVDFMQDAIKGNPNLVPLVGDLMFKAIDAPMADEISKRMKKMLPPQLQDGDDQEGKLREDLAKLSQAMQAAQQQMQQLAEENQKLKSGEGERMMKAQQAMEELELDKKVAEEKARVAAEASAAEIARKNWVAEQEQMLKRKEAEFATHCKMQEMMPPEMVQRVYAEQGMEGDLMPRVTATLTQTLGDGFGRLEAILAQSLDLQARTLQAFERPRSVAIGAIKKNGSGEITGAEISTELH